MPGFDQTTPITVGRTLGGRYRLDAPIARGGMAEVWEAYDGTLARPVAAKLLQSHLADDQLFLERFRREAVTAARLAHPGIVATFDTGVDEGTAFIVMELVRGRNLRQVLADEGSLDPRRAVAIARQVAEVLAYAHGAGLVHRDIKPANLLIMDDEWSGPRVKVTDFGIAKASAGLDGDLTRTGTVLGTPKYLSPEQIQGRDPDARADLYSLGVVLYEMLVGVAPFTGDTDLATAMAHLNQPVAPPSSQVRGIPSDLDRLVVDLLAKDPNRRIPSASILRQRLDRLGQVPSVTPPVAPVNGSQAPTTLINAAEPSAGPGLREPVIPGAREPVTSGPATRGFEAGAIPRGHGRSERAARLVVLSLIVVGAVVVAVLFNTGHHRAKTPSRRSAGSTAAAQIASVSVYMVNGADPPDNPNQTPYTFDGNPNTFWSTDHYSSPTFGNLYPGLGLSVELRSSSSLSQLSVVSPTDGWAAQVYVSAGPVASGQPIAAWGQATDSETDVAGDATFSLGGHTGRYVLLFLTNLGPADQARVAELTVK